MTETVESIAVWAAETFGPVESEARLIARANEEMAELVAHFLTPALDIDACVTEAADVVIVLCRQAHRDRIYLQDIIKAARPMLVDGVYSVGRANTALAKAIRAVTAGACGDAFALPVMDCVRWLAIFAEVHGRNLWTVIEAKMAVNRARVWKRDGNGVGYHVRDKSEPAPSALCRTHGVSVAKVQLSQAQDRAAVEGYDSDDDTAPEPCHRCGGTGTLVTRASTLAGSDICHHCNGSGKVR